MSKLICLTTAAILALSAPQAALAQHGPGGKDHGKAGHGGGPGRGHGGHAGQHGPERSHGKGADKGPARAPQQRADHGARAEARHAGPERGPAALRAVRPQEVRHVEARRDRGPAAREFERQVVYFHSAPDRGLIQGCPPGLAKKNNGCLPPGHAREATRVVYRYPQYDYVWGSRRDGYDYRYNDGYLYRVNASGGLLGYLPVLGGALSPGNVWPSQYEYQPVPTYYSRYYGLDDRYNYRYANGALYGVNPQNQSIGQVAALLTGQQWNVGQRMPSGYDIYNVPYGYRDQYADSADSLYRYNDGYVYQVDPTTRLVQAVIQLLT